LVGLMAQEVGVAPPVQSFEDTREAKPLRLSKDEEIQVEDLTYGQQLGSGGFGAVFVGNWRGTEVAIKKIFVSDSASSRLLAELEAEVAALRDLQHERLVRFIGASLRPPDLLIVTEFMNGGSLHHVLHVQKTPLMFQQQMKLGLQVSEGVEYLHTRRKPVVHRDLKSLNVVLSSAFDAKICDFGLTQSMDATHISCKEGGAGGSPRYMAPELYDSEVGKITEKVDIWALGCVLIETFGGPLPYDDCSNIQQIIAKIIVQRQGPYVPRHIRADVRAVIQGCLNFDIRARSPATEILKGLEEASLAA